MNNKTNIDLSNLPKYKNGNINWKKSIGKIVPFTYKNKNGEIKIKNIDSRGMIVVEYNNYTMLTNKRNIKDGKIDFLFTINNVRQLHKIGDIVNVRRSKHSYKIIGIGVRAQDNKKTIIYDCVCRNCGEILRIKQGDITSYPCPHCKQSTGESVVTSAPWMIEYFVGGYEEAKNYSRYTTDKIYPVCPYCGKISNHAYTVKHLYHRGFACSCSSKSMSYPERFMTSLLDQIGIEYIYQPTIKSMGFANSIKRYDFYIPSISTIIETHGLQHYEDRKVNWNKKTNDAINDKYKYDIAMSNGVKHYIVINCSKSNLFSIKKNILKSDLPNLLHFKEDDIDWPLCSHFKKEKIIKKICDDYKDNYLTVDELSEKYNLNAPVIRTYLRTGNDHGWCTFSKQINTHLKPVEMLKDGVHVGYFKHTNDVEKKSIKLFSKLLYHGHVMRALRNNTTYNGYTFKYVEDIPLRWDILLDRI